MRTVPAVFLRFAAAATLFATVTPVALLSQSQTPAPALLTFTANITIPFDLKDLNPSTRAMTVFCDVQQVGTSETHHFTLGTVTVTNGAYHNNFTSQFSIGSAQGFAPGTQWTYTCFFRPIIGNANGGGDAVTVGQDDRARIASGSATTTGTFTTQ